jgi:hypothetical protein
MARSDLDAVLALRRKFQAITRNSPEHRALAVEAAHQAAELLPIFEAEHPDDSRPRDALVALRAWASATRELSMAEVRKLSLGSHAAARAARSEAARHAARAIGHAIAVWHVPSHAAGVPYYGTKARKALEAEAGSPPSRG